MNYWSYVVSRWSKLFQSDEDCPTPRVCPSLLKVQDGRFLLFGGRDKDAVFAETWWLEVVRLAHALTLCYSFFISGDGCLSSPYAWECSAHVCYLDRIRQTLVPNPQVLCLCRLSRPALLLVSAEVCAIANNHLGNQPVVWSDP